MRLLSVETSSSPFSGNQVRLIGRIARAENGRDDAIEVWIDVPGDLAPALSSTANPWLLAMLPLALERGGTIQAELPVDSILLDNVKAIRNLWQNWWEKGGPVSYDLTPLPLDAYGDMAMMFFSGGVDSWRSALRRVGSGTEPALGPLDDLVCVSGFDQPLEDVEGFRRRLDRLKAAEDILGCRLFAVTTNLRTVGHLWSEGWGRTHTIGQAFVAMAMERRYRTAIWGSDWPFEQQVPFASLSLIDSFLASSSLRCVQDGTVETRTEKTLSIARDGRALGHLKVCQYAEAERNCCVCEKCMRTMATLEIAGYLGACESFADALPVRRLGRVYYPTAGGRYFAREIRENARAADRADIASALGRSLRRSAVADLPLGLARRLPWTAARTTAGRLVRRLFGFI